MQNKMYILSSKLRSPYLEDYGTVGGTGVIEKWGHQVNASAEMFWCWSSAKENEGFFYINFC